MRRWQPLAEGSGHVQAWVSIWIARGVGSEPVTVMEAVAQDRSVGQVGVCAAPPAGPRESSPCPGFVVTAYVP